MSRKEIHLCHVRRELCHVGKGELCCGCNVSFLIAINRSCLHALCSLSNLSLWCFHLVVY